MLERMIEMKLKEFIQTVIAPNTIIRLWKPLNQEKPYGGYICLTEKEQMNWEFFCFVVRWRKEKRKDVLEEISKVNQKKVFIFKNRK